MSVAESIFFAFKAFLFRCSKITKATIYDEGHCLKMTLGTNKFISQSSEMSIGIPLSPMFNNANRTLVKHQRKSVKLYEHRSRRYSRHPWPLKSFHFVRNYKSTILKFHSPICRITAHKKCQINLTQFCFNAFELNEKWSTLWRLDTTTSQSWVGLGFSTVESNQDWDVSTCWDVVFQTV